MKYGNERASNKDNMEVKIMEGNIWFQQKETYNKIYIPNGSISEEYSVDLE